MSYTYLGQTRSRTRTSESDSLAMNASDAELPGLCAQGNGLACQLANIPQLTEQDLQDMAKRRDEQASADQSALAQRLENVGQKTVADAVRKQEDVVYVDDTAFKPWHLGVAAGIALLGAGAYLYFR
jgi:hypothetical protein